MAVSTLLLIAVGIFCLLVPVAGVLVALYLSRRQQQPDAPAGQGLDPFGQPWDDGQGDGPTSYGDGLPTSSGEVRPASSPREFGATGGFRRVADQSASVGVPSTDDLPGTPRYGYVDPDPPLPYPAEATTPAAVAPEPAEDATDPAPTTPETVDAAAPSPLRDSSRDRSVEPQDTAFAIHAPSDDIEQTIRISRSSGELDPGGSDPAGPEPAQPETSWASSISVDEPEPVVEETVRRSDLRAAETVVEAPVEDFAAEDPVTTDAPASGAVSDEHTYWDDEEAEQARRAESLVETEEVVDGGYGWGSAAPFADGSMPPGHPVKGHRDWMQYHEPGSPWYDETTVDVWFTDAAAAERAGFHRA